MNYQDNITNKIFKVSNKVLLDGTGSPDVKYWLLECNWKNKIKFDDRMIANLLAANYMLSFFIYPNPKNFKEYKFTVYLLKLKNQEERLKVLAKKNNILSFSDIYRMADKVKGIYDHDLLITNQKPVDYAATAIFMALRKQGLI